MSPASNDVILFIERVDDYCVVYYEDEHTEIHDLFLIKSLKAIRKNNIQYSDQKGYQIPFMFGNTLLAPTKNIKDKDCAYFNLLKVDEYNPYYHQLLKERGLLELAKKRFLKQKKIELDHLYDQ